MTTVGDERRSTKDLAWLLSGGQSGLRSLICAIFLLIGGFATPAFAQDKQNDSIVVTGRRTVPDKQVRHFVRQVASTIDGQLSRFADPICPLAAGLSAESNRLIEGRIRQIATEAKVKLSKEPCKANLILMIAHDADTFVFAMRKRFPAMFAELSPAQLRRALKEGPVHVWSTIEVRNEDGQPIGGLNDDGMKVLAVRSASRITLPVQQVVIRSILVIDANATVGKTLTQISDYAAMRTMAGARPPSEPSGSETILTLFDKEGPTPAMLTSLDKGFLRGLYLTRLDGRWTVGTHVIARTILKDPKKND